MGVEQMVSPEEARVLLEEAVGFTSIDLEQNRLGRLSRGQVRRLIRLDGVNSGGAFLCLLAASSLVAIGIDQPHNGKLLLVAFALAATAVVLGRRGVRLFADVRQGSVSKIHFTACRIVNRENLWYGSHWCYTDGTRDFRVAPVIRGPLPQRIDAAYIAPRSSYLVAAEPALESVAAVNPDDLTRESR